MNESIFLLAPHIPQHHIPMLARWSFPSQSELLGIQRPELHAMCALDSSLLRGQTGRNPVSQIRFSNIALANQYCFSADVIDRRYNLSLIHISEPTRLL